MTLHCLYNTPERLDSRAFSASLEAGDALLLLGSAVTAASNNSTGIDEIPRDIDCFALAEDLQAHGIVEVRDRVAAIDYPAWVELAAAHATQCVWD